MKIIERLAQWISDFFFGDYDEDTARWVKEEKENRAKRDAEHEAIRKACFDKFHQDVEADLEQWNKALSKKPKMAEEKAAKKKVVTKKKTEGKAATKAKPARDANGKFVKKS